jgi:hypothetical protein
MFGLVITVIAIVLAVGLATAAIFYGGETYTNSSASRMATTIMTQGQMLTGAATLYSAEMGYFPSSLNRLMDPATPYITARPKLPAEISDSADWEMHGVDATHSYPYAYVLRTPASDAVCREVNRRSFGLAIIGGVEAGGGFVVRTGPAYYSNLSTLHNDLAYKAGCAAGGSFNRFAFKP